MARNNRLYYGIIAAGISKCGLNTFTAIKGAQSLGLNTKFNLEQLFQLGQLDIYENSEQLPDIEATIEKVLDGNPPIFCLATQGRADTSLAGRSNVKCTLAVSYFGDTQQAASGTPISGGETKCSGMYVSSLSYNFPSEGPFTESVTLVGNNKIWSGTGVATFTGGFTPTGSPAAAEGVNRRQHLVMASCAFPNDIPGISGGANSLNADGFYNTHFSSIKVSSNFGRSNLLELGTRGPYFRYMEFPVDVNTEFEVTAITGDNVSATEAGTLGNGNNLTNATITLVTTEGLTLTLGTKNKLASVNSSGGNAGDKSNIKHVYSYVNQNAFTVAHVNDPG